MKQENIILHEYDISAKLVEAQVDKIRVASRKAVKLGLSAYAYEVEPYTLERHEGAAKVAEARAIVRVLGEERKLNGWTFAATVDWSLSKPVLNVVPGLDAKLEKPKGRVCDHCQTVRSRKETFLVVSDDGEVKQVGRQCLTAYTGIPVGYVSEYTRDWDEMEVGGGYSEPSRFDTEQVMALGVHFTDTLGYVSKTKAQDDTRLTATSGRVYNVLRPVPKEKDAARRIIEELTEEEHAHAREAMAWATGWDGEDWEDNYRDNLRTICGSEYIEWQHIGYAISAYAAMNRDRVKKVEAAEKEPVPTGQGIAIEGEVVKAEYREDDYGVTAKWLVQGDGGWRVWGTMPRAIEENDMSFDELAGKRVSFIANVDASHDDPSFGFAKRPRKAAVTNA